LASPRDYEGRVHRRTRVVVASLVGIAILGLATVGWLVVRNDDPPPGPSQYPVYDWSPPGAIPPPGTDECKRVLLVGDSLAVQVSRYLERYFELYGYCAEVTEDVINGSAPADYDGDGLSDDGTWSQRLFRDISEHDPDLIVSFFNGNGGPALQSANRAETQAMVSLAATAGVPLYWVLPPLGAILCQWDSPENADGYRAYRQWVHETIPTLVPTTVNGNALTPSASPTAGPEAYNDRLRIDGEEETVRSFDCLHLVARGAEVLAYEVIFATQGAWAPPAVPTG
jgi:hypothetical protein